MSFLTIIPGFFGEVELRQDHSIAEPAVLRFSSLCIVCACTAFVFVVQHKTHLVILSFH